MIDLKTHEGMILYYSLKERFEYRLDDRQAMIENIAQAIAPYIQDYEHIVIPQSSSDFLECLLNACHKEFQIIPKNDIPTIIDFANSLSLQKKERASHLERISSMENGFKINLMKATQRVKYESVLFQNTPIPQTAKGLIIDDSCFSGTTYRALKHIAPNYDYLSIFAK